MKLHSKYQMKFPAAGRIGWMILGLMAWYSSPIMAQDDSMMVKEIKPVKNTFESIWAIDQQTVMVPVKGTFEMDFQHRFGTWNNGYQDLYGIFAASNIRFGFDYVPTDRLMVGLGFTKFNNLWDFYGKYALLRQMKGGGSPVSLVYYVNAAMDTRPSDDVSFEEASDRWSFFHQVMIARKITDKLSLQLSGNLSWFNYKDPQYDSEGVYLGKDKNGQISASALARYKISNVFGVIVEYDYPITEQELNTPEPNLSLGLELVTSSHAFQLFVGNFQSLVPQYNHSYNPNNFGDNEILVGFNITRLWNF